MQKTLIGLMVAAAFAGSAAAASPKANEAATARHYAALVQGQPNLAGLTMFFTRMPKGGDLHHHYSGSIYAEQYLEWVDKMGYCVNKQTYRIETDKAVVESQRALPAKERVCLSTQEMIRDDYSYREMLQRWSTKDFDNHGAVQPPPDRAFFETFGYFGPVSNSNFNEGLRTLKQRAIEENVSYIETQFKSAPLVQDTAWDAAVLEAGSDEKMVADHLAAFAAKLEQDAAFNARVNDFVNNVKASSAGIDDANFTMRYQTYVLRLLQPSQVFSSMLGAFKSARQSGGLIVGVNIVGAENTAVSMRDYALHMKMFRFLKAQYPEVKTSLHAGELSLGMVPPEGLRFHIDQAIHVAGADRIGHGIDLAHELRAPEIMKAMREKDIPVEINLTSNEFINGVKGQDHPILLYRKFGVPFVISTDDTGVTRHTLTREYVLFASRYQPSYAEVKKASYNGIRYAFLPKAEKDRLTRQLDQRFARFEADMAALSAKK
ncbi:adenosine deaminase [Pseudoduganella sp. GCM10020061]|uniref:adenosine deaminase family protein n=1 Tax=Pseudoduganella sp. GCM10020061 TaxID=3317345 RepID=UPI00362F8BFD